MRSEARAERLGFETGDERGGLRPPSSREIDLCSVCSGTGWEYVAGKGVRRCRCREEELRARLFAEAGIPPRYHHCSLSSYRPDRSNLTQARAFNHAYRLVEEYPGDGRGLLLAGPPGVGKTHLSVAILRGLAGKGVHCRFYDFGTLLKEIQGAYHAASQISELEVLAPVYEADALLLDELGTAKPTEWVSDTLRLIIGRRYNDRKLTLFTTNYRDERRRPGEETLEDRIGEPLRSRLYEMCRTITVEGEDWRRRYDC